MKRYILVLVILGAIHFIAIDAFLERYFKVSENTLCVAKRYYDPKLGRLLQSDTWTPGATNPLAFNRYAYAFNSPFKYSDPSGHTPEEISENPDIPLLKFGLSFFQSFKKYQRSDRKFLDQLRLRDNLKKSFITLKDDFKNGPKASRVAILHGQVPNSGKTVTQALQNVIGDQATITAQPAPGRHWVTQNQFGDPIQVPYSHIKFKRNPQANAQSASGQAWALLEETLMATRSTNRSGPPPITINLTTLVADPSLKNWGGARVRHLEKSVEISIAVDMVEKVQLIGHKVPIVLNSLETTLMHELVGHAGPNLMGQNSNHNDIVADIFGHYDEVIKKENLFRRAYNENNPHDLLGERSHFYEPWTRPIRRSLEPIFGFKIKQQ